MPTTTIRIFTDGGARGNPGPAAMGGVLYDAASGTVLDTFGIYLGETTNNQAEYRALIEALQRAKQFGATIAECNLDSQLVVEQMSGRYKVKNDGLKLLFREAQNMVRQFEHVTFHHIPREQNKQADSLVNRELDKHAPA